MDHRQRRVLAVLGIVSLIVLGVLIALLLPTPSHSNNTLSTPPWPPERLEACHLKISSALLDAGQTGMVQARENGTILLQLQARSATTAHLRLDADAAIWAALEAVAVASRSTCLDFTEVQVSVTVLARTAQPGGASERQGLRATARVNLPDLRLWSLGEIDDAELTLRINYQLDPSNSSE